MFYYIASKESSMRIQRQDKIFVKDFFNLFEVNSITWQWHETPSGFAFIIWLTRKFMLKHSHSGVAVIENFNWADAQFLNDLWQR